MAQKSLILLHKEAEETLVNIVNYFLQQGIPSSAMQSIFGILQRDLDKLVEQEMHAAQVEYENAIQAEQKAAEEANSERVKEAE